MRIVFYGNRQAGMIGLLTAMALGHDIVEVWEDHGYGMPGLDLFELQRRAISRKDKLLMAQRPDDLDLLLCVHGRRIIPGYMLSGFRLGGVNLHPFLDKYPGPNPVERAILAKETLATVYAHKMTDKVDVGEILASSATEMPKRSDNHILKAADVYNELYPLYAEVVATVLKKLSK